MCASESTPIFVTEFPDNILPLLKQADRGIAIKLVDLLADTSFNTNDLKRYINAL